MFLVPKINDKINDSEIVKLMLANCPSYEKLVGNKQAKLELYY